MIEKKFEDWFKSTFKDLHKMVEGGDCVARNHKKAMWLGYKSRQDEIDEIFEVNNKLLDRIKELFCEKEDALKQRDSFIKAHHIATNDVCNLKRELEELRDMVDVLEEQKITHFYKSKNTEINIKVLKKED